MDMNAEVDSAATWIAGAARPAERARLTETLRGSLLERFRGHWHVAEPDRGSAFRALDLTAESLDPLVASAVLASGVCMRSFLASLAGMRTAVLWCNPGVVKIRLLGSDVRILFASANVGTSHNPYSKPRLKIVPTRVHVRTDRESLPALPVACC